MIGTQDLMIALVIGLFFFGSKKLPELAGSLGKSMKEFKKATLSEADSTAAQAAPAPAAAAAPAPARRCVKCEAALEPDWAHCPRCGEAGRLV